MTELNDTKIDKMQQKLIHAQFYDRCKKAIDEGYYLEAMLLEYAYMEARVNRIMEVLNMPCASVKNTEIYRGIGLVRKCICLRGFLNIENKVFEKSNLSKNKINRIIAWCENRNDRIHNLYKDIDKYEDRILNNQKIAEKGYKYAQLLSKEANRLKLLNGKHPEIFDDTLKCLNGAEELDGACLKANEMVKGGMDND